MLLIKITTSSLVGEEYSLVFFITILSVQPELAASVVNAVSLLMTLSEVASAAGGKVTSEEARKNAKRASKKPGEKKASEKCNKKDSDKACEPSKPREASKPGSQTLIH